jgi:hypothetical protein
MIKSSVIPSAAEAASRALSEAEGVSRRISLRQMREFPTGKHEANEKHEK